MDLFTPLGAVDRPLFVTVDEAAAMTTRPASFFQRLVAEGRVPVLHASLTAQDAPVPLLLLSMVRTLADVPAPKRRESGVRLVMHARDWLRDYLAAVPPRGRYDDAVAAAAPFLARAGSRWGVPHAHVQVRFLMGFVQGEGVRVPTVARLEPQLREALVMLGVVPVSNGLRDESGRLRSRSWLRVPLTLWRPGPELPAAPVPVPEPVVVEPVEPGFEDDLSDVEPVEESL